MRYDCDRCFGSGRVVYHGGGTGSCDCPAAAQHRLVAAEHAALGERVEREKLILATLARIEAKLDQLLRAASASGMMPKRPAARKTKRKARR